MSVQNGVIAVRVICDVCKRSSVIIEAQETEIVVEKLKEQGWSFRLNNNLNGAVCPPCLASANQVAHMLGWVIE